MDDGKTNNVGDHASGERLAGCSARELIRILAADKAGLIRAAATHATNFSPDFACPLAVANLQSSVRYYAEAYAAEVEKNGELMARLAT